MEATNSEGTTVTVGSVSELANILANMPPEQLQNVQLDPILYQALFQTIDTNPQILDNNNQIIGGGGAQLPQPPGVQLPNNQQPDAVILPGKVQSSPSGKVESSHIYSAPGPSVKQKFGKDPNSIKPGNTQFGPTHPGKIQSSNVTSGAVHSGKVQNSFSPGKVQSGIVQGTKVQTGIVQGAKVQSGIVQGTKVQSGVVQGIKVQSGSLQSTKVQSSIVQGTNIQSSSVQGTKFQSVSLHSTKVQSRSVQGTKIQSGSLHNTTVQSSSVHGTKIQSSSIQGTKVQSTTLQPVGEKAKSGSIQSAKVQISELFNPPAAGVDVVQSELFSSIKDKAIDEPLYAKADIQYVETLKMLNLDQHLQNATTMTKQHLDQPELNQPIGPPVASDQSQQGAVSLKIHKPLAQVTSPVVSTPSKLSTSSSTPPLEIFQQKPAISFSPQKQKQTTSKEKKLHPDQGRVGMSVLAPGSNQLNLHAVLPGESSALSILPGEYSAMPTSITQSIPTVTTHSIPAVMSRPLPTVMSHSHSTVMTQSLSPVVTQSLPAAMTQSIPAVMTQYLPASTSLPAASISALAATIATTTKIETGSQLSQVVTLPSTSYLQTNNVIPSVKRMNSSKQHVQYTNNSSIPSLGSLPNHNTATAVSSVTPNTAVTTAQKKTYRKKSADSSSKIHQFQQVGKDQFIINGNVVVAQPITATEISSQMASSNINAMLLHQGSSQQIVLTSEQFANLIGGNSVGDVLQGAMGTNQSSVSKATIGINQSYTPLKESTKKIIRPETYNTFENEMKGVEHYVSKPTVPTSTASAVRKPVYSKVEDRRLQPEDRWVQPTKTPNLVDIRKNLINSVSTVSVTVAPKVQTSTFSSAYKDHKTSNNSVKSGHHNDTRKNVTVTVVGKNDVNYYNKGLAESGRITSPANVIKSIHGKNDERYTARRAEHHSSRRDEHHNSRNDEHYSPRKGEHYNSKRDDYYSPRKDEFRIPRKDDYNTSRKDDYNSPRKDDYHSPKKLSSSSGSPMKPTENTKHSKDGERRKRLGDLVKENEERRIDISTGKVTFNRSFKKSHESGDSKKRIKKKLKEMEKAYPKEVSEILHMREAIKSSHVGEGENAMRQLAKMEIENQLRRFSQKVKMAKGNENLFSKSPEKKERKRKNSQSNDDEMTKRDSKRDIESSRDGRKRERPKKFDDFVLGSTKEKQQKKDKKHKARKFFFPEGEHNELLEEEKSDFVTKSNEFKEAISPTIYQNDINRQDFSPSNQQYSQEREKSLTMENDATEEESQPLMSKQNDMLQEEESDTMRKKQLIMQDILVSTDKDLDEKSAKQQSEISLPNEERSSITAQHVKNNSIQKEKDVVTNENIARTESIGRSPDNLEGRSFLDAISSDSFTKITERKTDQQNKNENEDMIILEYEEKVEKDSSFDVTEEITLEEELSRQNEQTYLSDHTLTADENNSQDIADIDDDADADVDADANVDADVTIVKTKQKKKRKKKQPAITADLPEMPEHLKRKPKTVKPVEETVLDLSRVQLKSAYAENSFELGDIVEGETCEVLCRKSWACTFCGKPGNIGNLDVLFGPYIVRVSCDEKHKTFSVWMHRDCAIWTSSICLSNQVLCGLGDTLNTAAKTNCSSCSQVGATLQCSFRQCRAGYHYVCAKQRGCTFKMENFTITCPNHKD